MAITTTWKIEVGTYGDMVNFTTRTLGVNINQQVDVNVIGRGTCNITLLNKDGALTPGGGGTYGTRDWFSNLVRVTALTNTGGVNTETAVFHGLVTDFALQDDGVFSTVTITALDGLSVAAKSSSASQLSGTYFYATALENLLVNQQLPWLGGNLYPTWNVNDEYNVTDVQIYLPTTTTAATFADLWQTFFIPTANDVFWGTTITYVTVGAFTASSYLATSLGPNTTRSVANREDFEFDQVASLTGNELPFDQQGFEQGFNNDTLITQAVINQQLGSSSTVTNTAATFNTYGARTVTFTQAMPIDTAAAQTLADRLANRYSTSRFTPRQLRVTGTMIKKYAADAAVTKWRALLSIELGIWQKAKITWTGSGSAPQTAYSVIKGRRIEITPSDCFVTLTLGNWTDNHGFILDADLLNTDRLG